MQENTVMLETLTVEENDLVSFSIVDLMEKETNKSTKKEIFLILEITTVSEYGLDKIKKIKMNFNQFIEAIAIYRADNFNFLDNPKYDKESIQKFFAATAEHSIALTE